LTREQFQALAAAYGGDIARWPAAARDEATLLAAAEPEFTRDALGVEATLDAALDELPRVSASAQLFEQIVAGAPRRRASPPARWRLWLTPAGLGAALAGVAAAGVLLGAQVGEQTRTNTDASAQSVADLDVSSVAEGG
jgi:hypothetical protein